MIPHTMENYFLASAGASAALVGLIFVAISLWPKEKVVAASPSWRAVAGGSFLAFINALLVPLNAFNPGLNLGWPVLTLSLLAISSSLWLGFPLLRRTPNWKRNLPTIIAHWVMIIISLVVYASEGYFGARLLLAPNETSATQGIAILLVFIYTLGLTRAWELLGVEQVGLRRWLNPLQSSLHPETRDEDRDENRPASLDQD